MKLEVSTDDKAKGVIMDTAHPIYLKVEKLLKQVYKKEVLYNYCGAIVPIASYIQNTLKIPALFVGLGNEDSNMHGANENIDVNLVKKGLKFATVFLCDS